MFDNAILSAVPSIDSSAIARRATAEALAKEDDSWDHVERFCRDYDGTPVI